MIETFDFPSGLVVTVDELNRTIRSKFPDGTELEGVASFDDEDVARARALGYIGTDEEAAWGMHRHHDLLHHVVARSEGWPFSLVLYSVARGYPTAEGFGKREERLVFLLQQALNSGLPGLIA